MHIYMHLYPISQYGMAYPVHATARTPMCRWVMLQEQSASVASSDKQDKPRKKWRLNKSYYGEQAYVIVLLLSCKGRLCARWDWIDSTETAANLVVTWQRTVASCSCNQQRALTTTFKTTLGFQSMGISRWLSWIFVDFLPSCADCV